MNLKEREGTNYYAKIDRVGGHDLVHLGKACYKLRFAFRRNPEYFEDFEEFEKFVKNHSIINHFGRSVDPDFFIKFVREKQQEASITDTFRKIGKGNLVRIVKEFNAGKLVADHHFVDEDFGVAVYNIMQKTL